MISAALPSDAVKGLYASVTAEAHEAWRSFCESKGVNYNKFIEVMGRRGPESLFDSGLLDDIIREARLVRREPRTKGQGE